MCSECDQIDEAIAHYKWIKGQIFDQETTEGVDRLIVDLEAKKLALHPVK